MSEKILWIVSFSITTKDFSKLTAEQEAFGRADIYCLLDKQKSEKDTIEVLKGLFLPTATESEVSDYKHRLTITRVILMDKSGDYSKRVSCANVPLMNV